jgi:hypothetical protein
MKNEVQRAMCRGGQWDGRTVTAKMHAPPSFFRYLKDEVDNAYGDDIPIHSLRFTRSKKVIFDNLAATRRKTKFRAEVLRILAEDELDAVRKVLGVSFGVGVMQPVPSLKQLKINPSLSGTVWLRNNDPVRIVTCCRDGIDIDHELDKPMCHNARKQRPIKMLCSYRGLDIRLNSVRNGITELSVQCRFVKVKGDSPVVKRILNKASSNSDGSLDSDSILMVLKGQYLTLDSDKVYIVTEVNCNGTVRCVSPSNPINEPIEITIEEANDALNRQCGF